MMKERKLLVQRLGLVDYESALAIQKETELAVKTGIQPDTLLLLEHPHTLTIGRRGDSSAVLLDEEQLKARNVTVFETNRGGKVTYHGLGQVVGYPIINLSPDREDVHRYVRDLEEVLIRTMSDFGIDAFRIEGLTGVHTRAESGGHRRPHRALGHDARLCAQRKHRSQLLRSDHRLRRRAGNFDGRVARATKLIERRRRSHRHSTFPKSFLIRQSAFICG
jgi:lipoate-protein ligase B